MAWRSVDIDLYTHSLDYLSSPCHQQPFSSPALNFLYPLLSMEGGGDSVTLHMQFLYPKVTESPPPSTLYVLLSGLKHPGCLAPISRRFVGAYQARCRSEGVPVPLRDQGCCWGTRSSATGGRTEPGEHRHASS
jgi:hypothetical protein